MTASQRRILIIKLVSNTREKIKQGNGVRSFKNCGITTAPDGSEDDQVNSEGIEEYVMLEAREKFGIFRR